MPNKKQIEPQKIIGRAYVGLKERVKECAKNDYPVLFIGETGSGKKLFARYFAEKSRRQGKFMNVNCAEISDTLLESELFGHIKGAFTGALRDRPGKITSCHKGILLLDELGDASRKLQASIYDVIEYKTFSKVGSDDEVYDIDTLIIAATNKPEALRKELIHRVHILHVPPLQKNDIPALVEDFLGKPIKRIYLDQLLGRKYPGNARELKKACDTLLMREGNKIFDKKVASKAFYGGWVFDYDRYEKEIKTWNDHIKPLLDQYGPKELKYGYMHQFDEVHQYLTTKEKSLARAKYKHRSKDFIKYKPDEERYLSAFFSLQRDVENILKLIDQLRRGEEDKLPEFKSTLSDLMKNDGWLPWLLDRLDEEYNPTAAPSPILPMPDMTFLLSLPFKEAKEEFQRILIEYNLEKHSNNKTKTAQALGISRGKLYRALQQT